MSSAFVAVHPERVHLNVLVPFAVQVAAFVTVPASQEWPSADCFTAVHPERVHFWSVVHVAAAPQL